MLIVAGFGIATLFKADSSTSQWVGYQVVIAAGLGLIVSLVIPIVSRQ